MVKSRHSPTAKDSVGFKHVEEYGRWTVAPTLHSDWSGVEVRRSAGFELLSLFPTSTRRDGLKVCCYPHLSDSAAGSCLKEAVTEEFSRHLPV